MLIKITQVYRHLLFNRLGRDDDELDVSIILRSDPSGVQDTYEMLACSPRSLDWGLYCSYSMCT